LCLILAGLAGAILLPSAGPAQQPPTPGEPAVANATALIRSMEERLAALDRAARERDEALKFLAAQVEAAKGAIDGGGETAEALRQRAAVLNTELEAAAQDRERLSSSAEARLGTIEELRQQIAALGRVLGSERTGRVDAEGESATLRRELAAAAEREQALAGKLAEREQALASLRDQMDAGRADLAERTAEIDRLTTTLASLDADFAAARDEAAGAHEAMAEQERQIAGLRQELGAARDETAARAGEIAELSTAIAALRQELEAARGAERQLAEQGDRVASLEGQLTAARADGQARAAEVERLEAEVATLRANLDVAQATIASSQGELAARDGQIAKLSDELSRAALESQVAELAQYRSEFFGRLRQVLGDRADVRIVGDRFVFQAEVLFASGSAKLDPAGETQLRALAQTLQEVAATIPPDVAWILRVDGHTDRRPISNEEFGSNWELSAARAIAVVDALIRLGVPAEHLAATGFAEWQPLDAFDDEIAYRRNRRIEFKLTER
jgi:chemotaxis protein MotB